MWVTCWKEEDPCKMEAKYCEKRDPFKVIICLYLKIYCSLLLDTTRSICAFGDHHLCKRPEKKEHGIICDKIKSRCHDIMKTQKCIKAKHCHDATKDMDGYPPEVLECLRINKACEKHD